MRYAFGYELLVCPRCGGKMAFLSCVLRRDVIAKMRDVARVRRRNELASERACASSFLSRVNASVRSGILWCAGYGYSATTAFGLLVFMLAAFVLTAHLLPQLTGQFCEGASVSCDRVLPRFCG